MLHHLILFWDPSPRIKISFLTCTEELISTPKIMILPPNSPVGNEKVPHLSSPISYPRYLHLSNHHFWLV